MKKSTLYFIIGCFPLAVLMGLLLIALVSLNPGMFGVVFGVLGIVWWFFWWLDIADKSHRKGE